MAKFKFRLQKLLEYRQLQEKWAQDAFLECMARKVEAEQEVEAIQIRKRTSLSSRPCPIDERQVLDLYITRLDDEIRSAQATVSILEDEVEHAKAEWLKAKQDADAIAKLKESELSEWQLEESRREQAELDEWAVTRRAA